MGPKSISTRSLNAMRRWINSNTDLSPQEVAVGDIEIAILQLNGKLEKIRGISVRSAAFLETIFSEAEANEGRN